MRDEDLDWRVYRALERCGSATLWELSEVTGADHDRLADSVKRLEKNLLLENRGEDVRLLSIDESILKCHLKYSPGPRLIMEDGVIKIKKENE